MKAAIDIGTNTVLLLVAEIKNGVLKPVFEEQRIPRLGKGVDADRMINEAATKRVADALLEYRAILDEKFPEVREVIVTATSAVRDARNKTVFMEAIRKQTGFQIRLLSGKEEAEWTAAGALSVIKGDFSDQETLILDIGGGSTEVAQLKKGEVTDGHSFDMGSVRFTERFLKKDPPSKDQIEKCRKEVADYFKSRLFDTGESANAVGVAGTVTSLAAMSLDLQEYDPEKLAGHILTIRDVKEAITRFSERSADQMLEQYPVYLKGRADIFLAGLLILEGFLTHFGIESMIVSTGGIRHGAILNNVSSR